MVNPIIHLSPLYCPKCETEDVMEIYTDSNAPIHYIQKYKFNPKENLKKSLYNTKLEFSYCKCTKCNTKFKIDWRGELPRAYFE